MSSFSGIFLTLSCFLISAQGAPKCSEESPVAHYKLSYFPIRGRAEIARQIFAVAGQDFEDNRIPKEDWPALKNSTPFGQLPLLHADGEVLAQSHAIARYLARRFGLNGKNEWEEAQVNAVADHFKDYQDEIKPFYVVLAGLTQGDLDKLREQVFIPGFAKHFGFFSRILKANTSGYLVGDGLTWVDLLIAQHISDVLNISSAALDAFPEFKAHQEKVQANANLKKWLETRPQTPF